MPYWKSTSKGSRQLENFSLATNQNSSNSGQGEFYEMEIGVVLDIVLDDTHPIFTKGDKSNVKIDPNRWPVDVNNQIANNTDIDYTWIGRALIRPLVSNPNTDKNKLPWAFPLDNNLSEYPLINETVILIVQGDKLYYTRKLNYHNWPNNNLDFSINNTISGKENTEFLSSEPYVGKQESIIKAPTKDILKKNTGYKGYAGKYFVANNRIRTVRRYEGDLLIESRHGQTIHMTAYDSNRENDIGDKKNADYAGGFGNPMILIRNRQRPILKSGQTLSLNGPNPATISGTVQEKNVGGYIEEDINHDGSSIHITSGQTISEWVTTCYKRMFGDTKGEEVVKYRGISKFKYPELSGDQIIIQSNRLVLSSRYGETFHYSKKRYGIVTDNEYTLDAHGQMVMTTHTKTVINSPAIYLGEYDQTGEPALLGQTAVNWMYELCNWLLEHTHWYIHSHVDAGKESPSQTQLPVQVQRLILLRDRLHTLMSRRVFITGGGFAPGQDGSSIPNEPDPIKINTSTGTGVPGEWNGKNYRSS